MKDLCARLPYGVVVKDRNGVHTLTPGNTEFIDLFNGKCNIVPYLFPLSSMTEEQKKEYAHILVMSSNLACSQLIGETTQDWLDKNYFDYRGLIPKGLAIDATDKNIY